MKKTRTVDQACGRAFLLAYTAACCVAILSMAAPSPLWAADPADSKLKDVEIITFFRANRDTLERLRQMAAEDAAVISLINERTLNTSHLREQRRAEYKTLLDQLGRDVGVSADSSQVTFRLEGSGSVIERSWMKGLAYLRGAPSKRFIIVSSLDHAPKTDGVYLVPIEENWYIAFGIID